jgi:hypothetical protein
LNIVLRVYGNINFLVTARALHKVDLNGGACIPSCEESLLQAIGMENMFARICDAGKPSFKRLEANGAI